MDWDNNWIYLVIGIIYLFGRILGVGFRKAKRQKRIVPESETVVQPQPQPQRPSVIAAEPKKPKKRHEKHRVAPSQPEPTPASRPIAPQPVPESTENDPTENFDLRKAVIMAEILQPKYDE